MPEYSILDELINLQFRNDIPIKFFNKPTRILLKQLKKIYDPPWLETEEDINLIIYSSIFRILLEHKIAKRYQNNMFLT